MFAVDEIVELSKAADSAGFGSLWLAEFPFGRSATSLLAVLSRTTKKIHLASGLICTPLRHPVVLAMEAQTLTEASGGRFVLGLGLRRLDAVRNRGEDKVALVEESVRIIRRLLSGDSTSVSPRFPLDDEWATSRIAHSDGAAKKIPVFLGATSPRMQKLAASCADGLLLGSLSSTGYVRHSRGIIDPILKSTGSMDQGFKLAVYVSTFPSSNERNAQEDAKRFILAMLPTTNRIMLQAAGISEFAGGSVTSDMINELVVVGTAEKCAQRARDYLRAGADMVIFGIQSVQHLGSKPADTLADIARYCRD